MVKLPVTVTFVVEVSETFNQALEEGDPGAHAAFEDRLCRALKSEFTLDPILLVDAMGKYNVVVEDKNDLIRREQE